MIWNTILCTKRSIVYFSLCDNMLCTQNIQNTKKTKKKGKCSLPSVPCAMFYLYLRVKCQKVTFLPLIECHSNLSAGSCGTPGNYVPPFKSHTWQKQVANVYMQHNHAFSIHTPMNKLTKLLHCCISAQDCYKYHPWNASFCLRSMKSSSQLSQETISFAYEHRESQWLQNLRHFFNQARFEERTKSLLCPTGPSVIHAYFYSKLKSKITY